MVRLTSITRFVLTFSTVCANIWYFLYCVKDIKCIPRAVVRKSRDPTFCRYNVHSHSVLFPIDEIDPDRNAGRVLYNLGREACFELHKRKSPNNVFRSLGHKLVFILRDKSDPRVLVGKVHHRLYTREEDSPLWAKQTASCIFTLTNSPHFANATCSLRAVLSDLNRHQPSCHSSILERVLLQRKGRLDHQTVVATALHPALAVLLIGPQTPQTSDDTVDDSADEVGAEEFVDSWPFARYVGGCGVLAVSEYVGCPVADFYYEGVATKVRIALKVLDVALFLDEVDINGIGVANRDFHAGNLAIGGDDRVYITDTDLVSLLDQREDVKDKTSWDCRPKLMQNTFEILNGVLSITQSKREASDGTGDHFYGFLADLDAHKGKLGLEPHPQLPTQKQWMAMTEEQRLLVVSDIRASLTETVYYDAKCHVYNFYRWMLPMLCIVSWYSTLLRIGNSFLSNPKFFSRSVT